MNTEERSAESVLRDGGPRALSRAFCQFSEKLLTFKFHLPVAVQKLNERRRCVLCSFLKETNASNKTMLRSLAFGARVVPMAYFYVYMGTVIALKYFKQFQIYLFYLIKNVCRIDL